MDQTGTRAACECGAQIERKYVQVCYPQCSAPTLCLGQRISALHCRFGTGDIALNENPAEFGSIFDPTPAAVHLASGPGRPIRRRMHVVPQFKIGIGFGLRQIETDGHLVDLGECFAVAAKKSEKYDAIFRRTAVTRSQSDGPTERAVGSPPSPVQILL